MKILKNRRRLHRVISELRDRNDRLNRDNDFWRSRCRNPTDDFELQHLRERVIELTNKNSELLDIKERHYKLLAVIDINDKVKAILNTGL